MPHAGLYDDNLYQFDTPQRSYWEATGGPDVVDAPPLSGDDSCDVAIVGGGYTGLSAALHLARDHSVDVRVLEAGHIGWGASGRNGGFCSTGGTGLSKEQLIKHAGLDGAKAWYAAQKDAVELVRSLATDESIEYQAFGNAEVAVAHTPKAFAGLQKEFETLELLGVDAELISADAARERFYESTEQYGAMALRPTFGLHPLRYCRGLAAAATRRGAKLHARSRVVDWQKSDDGHHLLYTRGGTLRARRVIFAMNGFIDEDIHSSFYGRTLPIISALIVTRPLTPGEIEAQGWRTEHPCYNTRLILNYYRLLPDNRFMFGGRGQGLGTVDDELRGYDELARTMRHIWPEWRKVEIDYRWHGLICYTGSLRPGIGHLEDEDTVWFGFGYHGNGVNNATWTGKQLADWIGNGRKPDTLPDFVTSLPNRFPIPKMRTASLRFALKIASWRDGRR